MYVFFNVFVLGFDEGFEEFNRKYLKMCFNIRCIEEVFEIKIEYVVILKESIEVK